MPEGAAIAIRVPYAPAAELPAIFKKAKEALEKAGHALFLSSEEKTARTVSEAVVKWAEEKCGEKLPRGEGIEIIVAKTHREAAEEICKQDTFPNKNFKSKEDFIERYLEEPGKGTALPELNKVIIDLQAIEEAHGGDKKAQETCLVATTIHETLHCLGGFEDAYRMRSGKNKYAFDIAWLLEGTTELLAQMVLGDKYPAKAKKFSCSSNKDNVENMHSLVKIVGIRTIFEAYFEGSFEKIRRKMNEEGIGDERIREVLWLVNELGKSDQWEADERLATYKELKKLLKGIEEFPAQTLQNTLTELSGKIREKQAGDREGLHLLIGVKNEPLPEEEIISLVEDGKFLFLFLSYPDLKEKYGEKMKEVAVYNTVLATLYSLGSFGEHEKFDLEWLRASYSIHLAERSMETKEREILKEIEGYPAQAIEELVGKEIMRAAFKEKSIFPIIEELEKARVPKELIEELFISGSEAAQGKSQNRFTLAYLKIARKINPNDAEADSAYRGIVFGPLGEEASEKMSKLQSEEGSETHRKARETAIRMKLIGGAQETGQEFSEEWLLENFNDGSEYARNGMMGIVQAYSELNGLAPAEAGAFIGTLAEEFEGEYSVKPTVTQLMNYAAAEIYGELSYRPDNAMEILREGHTAEEIGRIEKAVEGIPKEVAGERFNYGEGCQNVFSEFPEIRTPKDQEQVARNAMLLLNCKCNIAAPTTEDVAAMVGSFAIRVRKEGAAVNADDVAGKMKNELLKYAYPLNPDCPQLPPVGSVDVNGRVLSKDKLEAVGTKLSIAFPFLVSSIDDKFGIRLYDEDGYLVDPINAREKTIGSIEGFQPYGAHKEVGADFDPAKSGPNVERAVSEIADMALFSNYKPAGEEGKEALKGAKLIAVIEEYVGQNGKIKFDMNKSRPNGCLSAEEVLDRGYALCLEHTYLFLALSKNLGYEKQALGFKVFAEEFGNLVPHVVGGIVVGSSSVEYRMLRGEKVAWQGRMYMGEKAVRRHERAPGSGGNARGENNAGSHTVPVWRNINEDVQLTDKKLSAYGGHYLFELDSAFRERVLGIANPGCEDPKLLLIDLSWSRISPQYKHVVPMSSLELLSAYFTNAGTYFLGNGKEEKALENFERALRINPEDEMCRSHLIEYFSKVKPDAQRVLELSEDSGSLVNPRDFLNRALALLCIGKEEEAVISALKSLQVSENYGKAREFLEEIGFRKK